MEWHDSMHEVSVVFTQEGSLQVIHLDLVQYVKFVAEGQIVAAEVGVARNRRFMYKVAWAHRINVEVSCKQCTGSSCVNVSLRDVRAQGMSFRFELSCRVAREL